MAVSRSAFNASAGMVSEPDAFSFFSFSTAFLISFLVVGLLIVRGVSTGGMSLGSSGAGRYHSSEKYSFHLLGCS